MCLLIKQKPLVVLIIVSIFKNKIEKVYKQTLKCGNENCCIVWSNFVLYSLFAAAKCNQTPSDVFDRYLCLIVL